MFLRKKNFIGFVLCAVFFALFSFNSAKAYEQLGDNVYKIYPDFDFEISAYCNYWQSQCYPNNLDNLYLNDSGQTISGASYLAGEHDNVYTLNRGFLTFDLTGIDTDRIATSSIFINMVSATGNPFQSWGFYESSQTNDLGAPGFYSNWTAITDTVITSHKQTGLLGTLIDTYVEFDLNSTGFDFLKASTTFKTAFRNYNYDVQIDPPPIAQEYNQASFGASRNSEKIPYLIIQLNEPPPPPPVVSCSPDTNNNLEFITSCTFASTTLQTSFTNYRIPFILFLYILTILILLVITIYLYFKIKKYGQN